MQWFPKTMEKSRLKWVFVFRLIIHTFLCLIVLLIYLNGRAPAVLGYWTKAIVVVMFSGYVLAVCHYFLWPRLFGPPTQILLQMVLDILWASAIITQTGGCESPLNFAFIVVVINSVFLGGLRLAFVAATLSTVAWATILDLHYYGYLPGLPALGEFMGATELALNILVNTGASYLVAVLGGRLSVQLDISSQALHSSQTSLDRLSELNENIVRSIDSGLITTDNDGRILSVNQAARELLKVDPIDVVSRHWLSFFPELETNGALPDSEGLNFNHYRAKGLRFRHNRLADGAELMIELSILTLTDFHNESWGRLLVLKDQTTMVQLEAENKRNEHMAAVGGMAAGLAHEIRTPLASMIGSWDMILNHGLDSDDQNRLMTIIGREMQRLRELVDDFLSFARPSAGNPQPVDLNLLIGDQVHVFSSWKGMETKIVTECDEIPPVFFDYGQLSQVVFNLFQNALEARAPGRITEVTIRTGLDPVKANTVYLTISDNGQGISEENIKRIFEPFFTTKTKGTGLGLAMVWGILGNGNAAISVASTPGILTTFTVQLPIYRPS
ncbi:MAG: PAS domain-containing protein [Deltaproteobacteria bacterium]|jgi:two-component system sensor histidine kinase PilS (NtrC family)|nr:PAS domain-containing protein [Deltaproteobacteria bacterium]